MGEREKTIKYRFFEVKEPKQGVLSCELFATQDDYAARVGESLSVLKNNTIELSKNILAFSNCL